MMNARLLVLSIAAIAVIGALLAVAWSSRDHNPPEPLTGSQPRSLLPTTTGRLNYAQQTHIAEINATSRALETLTARNDATTSAETALTPLPTLTATAVVSAQQTKDADYRTQEIKPTADFIATRITAQMNTRAAKWRTEQTRAANQTPPAQPVPFTPLPTSTPWWNPPTATPVGNPSPTPRPTATFAPTATASPPSTYQPHSGGIVCNTPWGTFPGSCPQ